MVAHSRALDDHPVDEHGLEHVKDSSLVSSANISTAGERAADLAGKLAVEAYRLINELFELGGHGAVIGG